mgnify:CR=1 FL=1
MKKRMTQAQFQQIRRWVLRNGRPLEWARWQAMFEGGSRNQAAEVLSGYQNADGGFGWGLEPDCMNPQSSPYQTGSALALAEALQLDARDHTFCVFSGDDTVLKTLVQDTIDWFKKTL